MEGKDAGDKIVHKESDDMGMWRLHPVLLAFLVGAVLGLLVAIALAVLGPDVGMNDDLLVLLWPASVLGFGSDNASGITALLVAIVVFGGNAIVYGFVFAAPVGLIVAVRRSFGKPEKPTSIGKL